MHSPLSLIIEVSDLCLSHASPFTGFHLGILPWGGSSPIVDRNHRHISLTSILSVIIREVDKGSVIALKAVVC